MTNKPIISRIIVCLIVVSLYCPVTWASSTLGWTYIYNNERYEGNARNGHSFLENGVMYIPLGEIGDMLGYYTNYELRTGKIRMENGVNDVVMYLDRPIIEINGEKRSMNASPTSWSIGQYDMTYFVPLRDVVTNLGGRIDIIQQKAIKYICITTDADLTPSVPIVNPKELGELQGMATDDFEADMKVISNYFDKYNHGSYPPSFNPLGGPLDNSFIHIEKPSAGEKFEVGITLMRWETDRIKSEPYATWTYQLINYTAQQLFKFYLPNGYEKLYQIIDDGYNNRLPNEMSYMNVDLQYKINSDGRSVKICEGPYGGLRIEIGYKKK